MMMHSLMKLTCVAYVDDEHVDKHDHDDSTDDHDSINDITVRAFNARVQLKYIYIERERCFLHYTHFFISYIFI